ncbi:MAG: hypothetical protein NZ551_06355 [Microscillaceae bacterium]|nr:hypothetical protein [Microscillaceae bacterium]MDW8460815.1 hypothetical protein [Cytophagales bacterium]
MSQQATQKLFNPEKLFITDKLAYRYFKKLVSQEGRRIDSYHVMNDYERQAIRRVYYFTLFMAAVWGTLGVLALYLPQYWFPEWFNNFPIVISWISSEPLATWESLIYGVVLVIIEIALLTIYNLKAVQKIAYYCGFPILYDPNYEAHVQDLFRLGMEQTIKDQLLYGINPLEGLPPAQIFLYNLINRIKATLSGIVAKIILRRFLGRYALRAYLDMSGIPIFAFWNAWAAHLVIHETKLRIMATSMIPLFVRKLEQQIKDKQAFASLLADVLQFIAVVKRNFHHNHSLLVKHITETLNIPVKREKPLNAEELLAKARTFDTNTQQAIIKLIVFGMIIDGKLSKRDIDVLKKLQALNLLLYDIKDIQQWVKDFKEGKGLDTFLAIDLPSTVS